MVSNIFNYCWWFLSLFMDFLMCNKSETREHIKHFIVYCHNQFSWKIKTIWSDNGTEFIMPIFYASLGIIHQKIYVETPQQNSIIDRKHIHLINVTRSLLFHAHLNKCFWSYDVWHATYLINRICSPIIDNKTPYDILFQQPHHPLTISKHLDVLHMP